MTKSWEKCVIKTRKLHPNKKFKTVLKIASKKYRKKSPTVSQKRRTKHRTKHRTHKRRTRKRRTRKRHTQTSRKVL
jgi:hypothetical protein